MDDSKSNLPAAAAPESGAPAITSEQTIAALQAEIASLTQERQLLTLKRQVSRMKEQNHRGGLPKQIRTISEFIEDAQQEAEDIKNGLITSEQARGLSRVRGHILQAAGMQLAYARLYKGRAPDPEMRLVTASKE